VTAAPASARPPGTVLAHAEAAYLGLALGDALGATVEFMTPREIVHHYGVHREIVGGGWLRLKPGQITDDTGMSLALGEAILAKGGNVVPLACAEAFDAWMRSKPIDIGNTVRRNLIRFRNSGNPVAEYSDHDAGNGAAMRVLPVALVTLGRSEAQVRAACRAQARVTHHNALSDAACEFLVLTVQDFITGQPTQRRALRNIRIHGESSPQPSGCHDICAVRNTRSGCGIMIVNRPSAVVRPATPAGEPFGLYRIDLGRPPALST
jgi:ADP-ribosyl-[dinitrogen reductase] hydrolase